MEKNIKLTISVPVSFYGEFKEECKAANMVPATVLKKMMAEFVKGCKEKNAYKIISWNICNNPAAVKELSFIGTNEMRMLAIAKAIVETNCDAAFISEFSPAKCDGLVELMEANKYRFYYPEGFDKNKDKRKNAMTVLAVKDDVVFSQEYSDKTKLTYRFISGLLQKEGEEPICIMGIYVPMVDCEKASWEQEIRKEDMLSFAIGFMDECEQQNVRGIIFGDFNCDMNMECYGKAYFKKIIGRWVDTAKKAVATFRKERLDYCFASPKLLQDYHVVTDVCEENDTDKLSDHKKLEIKIY